MTPDNTEGELTELDAKVISTIESEFKRPEEIAKITRLALPQVMKRLRELVADGLVVVRNAKYGTPAIAAKASERNKLPAIFGFISFEIFAIVGALPLFSEYVYIPSYDMSRIWARLSENTYTGPPNWSEPRWDLHTWSLWDNTGALAGFLIGATLLTILYVRKYVRKRSIKTQVISTAVVVGILLGSALGVNALG